MPRPSPCWGQDACFLVNGFAHVYQYVKACTQKPGSPQWSPGTTFASTSYESLGR